MMEHKGIDTLVCVKTLGEAHDENTCGDLLREHESGGSIIDIVQKAIEVEARRLAQRIDTRRFVRLARGFLSIAHPACKHGKCVLDQVRRKRLARYAARVEELLHQGTFPA